ncbi:MAG: hypothetical protein EPO26_11725 [Chloroflexota bacterium]|nr:MAG: hypothetical protein EPO26_11725 [Chloroflexota bacterium]
MVQDAIRRFIAAEEEFERGTGTEARAADWQFSLTGDEAVQRRVQELSRQTREHFSDRDRFGALSRWRADGRNLSLDDRRQVELYWRDYVGAQEDAATRDEIVRVQTEQAGLFNRFRAELDGRTWTENELNDELATTRDSGRAQQVWEAAKQIGGHAADRARQLVRLTNGAARALGFRDAYERGLTLSEVGEERLFALLDQLEQATDGPYRAAKGELDAQLAERFGIPIASLRPWHYADPFFQRPPRASGPNLDRYFNDKDPIELALRATDSLGLDARKILERSDNWPKPGKNQHAFCTWIAADGSDVRVLNNLDRSHHWTGVLLHELGHALAAEYADRMLPLRLILWPNGIIAETESQTIDRMANDARWLHEAVGIPAPEAESVSRAATEQARLAQLLLARWCLVQAHFERAMHRDPDGDLNTLWWDLVERYQFITRPEGRNESDWAAKIHNAQFPGHYYVYIVGEMAVSQFCAALMREVGGLYGHPAAGEYLTKRLYRLGARWDWEETVQRSTGARLTVDSYVNEWFT